MRQLPTTLVLMLGFAVTAGAQEEGPPQYAGRTLDEWREVIKTLEPSSPAAADAVPGLIAIVSRSDVPEPLRAQAAYTLGRIGTEAHEAVPVLTDLLTAADESDREETIYWAAKALGLFASDAADSTPELIAVATDDTRSLHVRLTTTEALGSIGGAHPDAIPALMQLAGSGAVDKETTFDRNQLRGAAVDSLGMIGPAAGAAVPLLIRMTRDDAGDLRKRAAAALGSMGTTAGVAIEALVDLVLFDDLREVRDAAALALGRIGEAGQSALAQLLTDSEVSVRRQAAGALGTVAKLTNESRAALEKSLQDADVDVRLSAAEAWQKLTEGTDLLVPVVIDALAEEDRQSRIRAYRLVVEMRSQSAVILPRLQALANDERSEVRQVVRKAITELTEPDSADQPTLSPPADN